MQSALEAALATWVARGVPRDPGAWLHRVACNALLGALRQDGARRRILARDLDRLARAVDAPPAPSFPAEIADDLLRMLFVCCDEVVPQASRLVFALKTLCGFSTAEIALRLFTTEANVHKRLQRARTKLRSVDRDTPPLATLRARLSSVHEVLYLLFNEGYLSSRADAAIRRELCDEAVRLTTLLARHPVGATPATHALLALMHLHAARFAARVDGDGALVSLADQDRAAWDAARIHEGLAWLARSATGDAFTRFHAEAGIAAEHCTAPSYAATRWHEIDRLYAVLERIAPSPLHTLHRAVAVAAHAGPRAGLALLSGVDAGPLAGAYVWDAVCADLHRRAGDGDAFRRHRERALRAAPTDLVRASLRARLV